MRLSICFLGIDGSGKTTLAVSLCKKLRLHGFNCRYVHISYSIAEYVPLIIRMWIRKYTLKPSKTEIRSSQNFANSSNLRLETILAFLLLVSAFFGYIKETKHSKHQIITVYDRYLYDPIINFFNALPKSLVKCLMRSLPKPNLIFLLDIPAEVAYERKKEASLSFLKSQRELYLCFAKQSELNNLIIIDAECSLNKAFQSIFSYVNFLLKIEGNGNA